MAVSVAKCCDKNNTEDMEAMMNGWVEMEDSNFCRQVLDEEVSWSLLDLDVLCKLKEVPEGDDKQKMMKMKQKLLFKPNSQSQLTF